MNVEIRKGHGIDHLVGGYSPGKVEEEKELASNPFFVSLFAKYEKAVYEDLVRLWQMDFILGENYVDEVLLPKQINAFLQATIQYMRPGYHFTENTAVFINKLIQNSYSAGNNGFHLNLPVTDLLCVGSHLQGKKERPIELHVKGRAGAFSGWSSEYLNLSVEGMVDDHFAECSKNCCFTLTGEVTWPIGSESRDTTFRFADREKTFEYSRHIPRQNKVVWLREDGREIPISKNGS